MRCQYLLLLSLWLVQVSHSQKSATHVFETCPGAENENKAFLTVLVDAQAASGPQPPNEMPLALDVFLNQSVLARILTRQARVINEDDNILPYHQLCLFIAFVPSDLSRPDSPISIVRSPAPSVTNALANQYQFMVHRDILVPYLPQVLVRIPPWSVIGPGLAQILDDILITHKYVTTECVYTMAVALDLLPHEADLLHSIDVLIHRLGWEKFGVVVDQSLYQGPWNEDRNVFISAYNPDAFIESFDVFRINEINIYVYLGDLESYLRFMIVAYEKRIAVVERFVWIFPYFQPNFDIKKGLAAGNFTPEEVRRINIALTGTIVVLPILSDEVNLRSVFDLGSQVLEGTEGYLADALTLQAMAYSQLVQSMATATNTTPGMIDITSKDVTEFAVQLLNVSFVGYTGQVQYNANCHRTTSTYSILNFVPSSGRSDTPYVVQARGRIYVAPGNDTVMFLDDRGNETEQSTIVFKDGTTNIPADRIPRPYYRNNAVSISILVILGIMYFVVMGVYLGFMAWQDRRALIFNDTWLYEEKEINYNSQLDGNCNVAMTHEPLPMGSSLIDTMFEGTKSHDVKYGEVDNMAVEIYDVNFDLQKVTVSVREQLNLFKLINHPNVAPFIGCITNETEILSIMFENCVRGTMYATIRNPSFILNPFFLYSFANDIANGLAYLHSKRLVHGSLSSKKCIINQHWLVKITGFIPSKFLNAGIKKRWKRRVVTTTSLCNYNIPSDVFSYGLLLKEMACQESILKEEPYFEFFDTYDSYISSQYIKLIDQCTRTQSSKRPSMEVIKSKLKKLTQASGYLAGDASGIFEVYSRNLEELVDETESKMEAESHRHFDILSNYVPKEMIQVIKDGVMVPLEEYDNVVILCILINDMEKLFKRVNGQEAEQAFENAGKMLDGVAHSYKLNRLQSIGSVWLYVGGVFESNGNDFITTVTNTVWCALKMRETFEKSTFSLIPSLAIHSGALVCGVINREVPRHIAVGNAIQNSLLLVSSCPSGGILVSQHIHDTLDGQGHFMLSFYRVFVGMEVGESYKLAYTGDIPSYAQPNNFPKIMITQRFQKLPPSPSTPSAMSGSLLKTSDSDSPSMRRTSFAPPLLGSSYQTKRRSGYQYNVKKI